LAAFLSVKAQTFTPVYEPEGVNMPGSWNNWANKNDETMGKLRMKRRNIGGGQYVTTISVGTTGQTVQPGSFKMLFTSGPSTNFFQNKWGGANLTINDTTRLIFGGADNDISVTAGHYTFVFDDRGYANTRVAVMRTTGEPITILEVKGVPASGVVAGQAVSVTLKYSGMPSNDENVFIRYSTDGWRTSQIVEASAAVNASFEAPFTIPGQAAGTVLSFYAVSTSVNPTKFLTNPDRFTINLNNNDGTNYTVFFGEMPVLIAPAASSTMFHPRTFSWSPQQGAVRNRIQIARYKDTGFTQPVFDSTVAISTSPTTLNLRAGILTPGDTFIYRVRGDTSAASLWSLVRQFRFRPGIVFGNLETGPSVIQAGDTLTVSGRFYIEGATNKEGAAPNVSVWAGISTNNTNPSSWTESAWTPAAYVGEGGPFGNDDVYEAKVGFNLAPGTYFVAFRYQYYDDTPFYGGYSATSGGKWDGVTNVNSILSVTRSVTAIAPEMNALAVDTLTAFFWRPAAGATGYDLQVALATDAMFSNPAVAVTAHPDTSLRLSAGTALKRATWYAWRVRVSGTENPFTAPQFFKTASFVGFHNLQFVDKPVATTADTIALYAQIYIAGYTDLPEIAAGVESWIGVHSADTNPAEWPETAWKPASFNTGSIRENNDEYVIRFHSANPAVFYAAARFRYRGGGFLYGGTSAAGGGSWNGTTNKNAVIEIKSPVSVQSAKPVSLELLQNYPNPFNPETVIGFSLPQTSHVKLEILDLSGRTVAELVNETRPAGHHNVRFAAIGLASGVYMYRLTAGPTVITRKLTLLK
jgi:hypothetical protein